MINSKKAKKYCSEWIMLIENYERAVNDKTRMWHCHHKAQICKCGVYSARDLIKFGLYWNRPANELIFLPPGDHNSIHRIFKQMTPEERENSPEAAKGKYTLREDKVKRIHCNDGTHNYALRIDDSRLNTMQKGWLHRKNSRP